MKNRRIIALLGAMAVITAACSGPGTQSAAPATQAATEAPATTAPESEAPASEGTASEAPSASAEAEGCPAAAEALRGKTIGVIYLIESHPYYQAHKAWSEDLAQRCGITLNQVDGKADSAVMTTAMEQFIAQQVDGIIFALLDPAAADPVINDALAANIPVVTFAIKHGANAHVPFVGIPEGVATEAAGREAAERFHAAFGADTPAKMIMVDCPAVAPVVERTDGFLAGFTAVDPNAELLARIDGNCVRADAVTAMEDAIQAHPDVNVVYGGNGDNSLGALAALEGAGLGTSDKVFLTSHDGSEPEVLELVDPTSALKLSVANRPKELSQATFETLGEVLAGTRPRDQDGDVLVEAAVLNPDDLEALQEFIAYEYRSTTDITP